MTRVVEFLAAGVPVVANRDAARSLKPQNGLVIVQDAGALRGVDWAGMPASEDIPAPATPDAGILRERISSAVQVKTK